MSRSAAIDTLLDQAPQLWRGREPNRSQQTLATGHSRLDARLPGGGWPVGALTELIAARPGLGEFSVLLPALAQLSRAGQWLVFIDPPWIPYPAALHGRGLALERVLWVRTEGAQESLWACEQALAAGRGGAVLAWPELSWRKPVGFARLRRLQLAAEAGAKPAFLFRPEDAATAASPAALRLRLNAAARPDDPACDATGRDGTRVDILKCRGERPRQPTWLPPHHPFGQAAPRHAATQPEANDPRTPAASGRPEADSTPLN
ncbi:translesion DNA synthesis-associated protein ImuA [Elongatibacter sediminis]|uniref:Translesion DNA synthesis-associated protein ImuA n=1 Tax=Elongatibacter sediminis TaxID=3119006 RepID=A0AAW9RDT0_9GAMM